MSASLSQRERDPAALSVQADTLTVQDLVKQVLSGRVRVPTFQRGLKWKADDVRKLYDSIYQGYPVGSFLLQKAPAEADTFTLGPLTVEADAVPEALWVVDGQQRIVSLAVGLARPRPIPLTPDDEYVVYFDPRSREFVTPPRSGGVPLVWVPVAELRDGSSLTEWVFKWPHGKDEELRRAVFEAGDQIRQYRIPLYTVGTNDHESLRAIFLRVNNSGRPLEWQDVYEAMYGAEGQESSMLDDLGDEVESWGMGRLGNDQLLNSIVASRGLDVTQNVSVHYDRDPAALADAETTVLPALRRALLFLRTDAKIPHVRLLPVTPPLPVLVRFFTLYPDPGSRTRILLARWTWRVVTGGTPLHLQTLVRRGVANIDLDDEHAAAQILMGMTLDAAAEPYELPARFDTRTAASRLALLGLADLEPQGIGEEAAAGEPLDTSALLNRTDGAVPQIWDRWYFRRSERAISPRSSPANRILLPTRRLVRADLVEVAGSGDHTAVLRSHGIEADAKRALLDNDALGFVRAREKTLTRVVRDLIARMVAWEQSDHSSISSLFLGKA
ncbi:MAG: DUF262 domain-containing protein [Bacteroidota bacterium]